jgi:16S rRNA (uracil1498-N3)-methyltransferase
VEHPVITEGLMSLPRFFLASESIQDGRVMIRGEELLRMRKVLRLRPGSQVLLFDTGGTEHEAFIHAYGEGAAEVTVVRSYDPGRESPLAITLAQAISKGEKMDWVVEKTTELGVSRIVPFLSSHTVPKLDHGRGERRRERWSKIAISAAKQSGRTHIPKILPVHAFDAILTRDWECEAKLFFWEGPWGKDLFAVREEHAHLRSVLVVVGAEGGFSAEEASAAEGHEFETVRLGRRILRTETAAMAAVCAVQLLWGDMG